MKLSFDEFDKKDNLKSNIKSAIFFIVTLIVSVVVGSILLKANADNINSSNNGFADLIAIVLFLFTILFILVVYNAVVVFKMKIYKDIMSNVKSLIALTICNLLITGFLYVTIKSILPWMYIGSAVVIDCLIFSIRYSFISNREKKVQ